MNRATMAPRTCKNRTRVIENATMGATTTVDAGATTVLGSTTTRTGTGIATTITAVALAPEIAEERAKGAA
eukprot:tig00000498_g1637.t1